MTLVGVPLVRDAKGKSFELVRGHVASKSGISSKGALTKLNRVIFGWICRDLDASDGLSSHWKFKLGVCMA